MTRGHARSMGASRLMVVDDDPTLLRALESALEGEVADIRCCAGVATACALLKDWLPEILLLDVTLPDGDAFGVLEALRAREPTPLVVAITGTATPAQAFRLAELGVRAYVEKPFTVAELREAVARARREPPSIEPQLRNTVGHRGLREVEQGVRTTLVREAMARAGGSRTKAAALLGVSRQLLQHILRRRHP